MVFLSSMYRWRFNTQQVMDLKPKINEKTCILRCVFTDGFYGKEPTGHETHETHWEKKKNLNEGEKRRHLVETGRGDERGRKV